MRTRVARKMWLQRGRPIVRLDPGQYLLESQPRGRATRGIRALLRQGVPVLLRNQRWSGVRGLLGDIAIDLRVADAAIQASVLNLESLSIKEDPQGWAVFLDSIRDALGLPSRAARMPLDDQACFDGIIAALGTSASEGARALLCCGGEAVPVRALDMLSRAFTKHQETVPTEPVRLLIAASNEQRFSLEGQREVVLPDLSPTEGVGTLVEHGSTEPSDLLHRVVWMLGGVPEFVERAAYYRGELKSPEWRRVLGSPYIHLRQAIAMARTHEAHARRLDILADLKQHPCDPADDALAASGLVRRVGAHSELRAPLVAKVDRALTR